jgi:hypothetical protein
MGLPGKHVTLTLFRFGPWRDRLWGFRQMGASAPVLARVSGLRFHRLLGTGSGDGFSPWPDTRDIGLLQVWVDEAAARAYFTEHPLHHEFLEHAGEHYRMALLPEHGHGRWAGVVPFGYTGERRSSGPVAVITRATIRWGALPAFWRSVPPIRRTLARAPGLVFAEGIGEWPLFQQATFSVWRDVADMMHFAYTSAHHRQAVADTRRKGWFSEELFARFSLLGTHGSWGGGDPLAGILDRPVSAFSVPPV